MEPETPAPVPALASPTVIPGATPAEFMEAIGRIERRLDELSALQPAAAAPAEVGPDVAELQRRIQATQIEIAALRHPKAEQDRLVVAGEELAAIVSATETATNGVLSAAEFIEKTAVAMKARLSDPRDKRDLDLMMDAVVSIFEACNFQDLTGQRITKVVRALSFIEERVEAMMGVWNKREFETMPLPPGMAAKDGDLDLHGPNKVDQAKGMISQADIDALFG